MTITDEEAERWAKQGLIVGPSPILEREADRVQLASGRWLFAIHDEKLLHKVEGLYQWVVVRINGKEVERFNAHYVKEILWSPDL